MLCIPIIVVIKKLKPKTANNIISICFLLLFKIFDCCLDGILSVVSLCIAVDASIACAVILGCH